jgi:hypothetical protein
MLGHTMASGIGFICFSAIEVILKRLLGLVLSFGSKHEVELLEKIDAFVFYSGIFVFGVSFAMGIIRFILAEIHIAKGG